LARSTLDTGLNVVNTFVDVGLFASKGQARTAIAQGGAYVNNKRVESHDAVLSRDDLLHGRYLVLRKGRRDYHLLRFD
jgi:tyrosyl-tRNA synthetase